MKNITFVLFTLLFSTSFSQKRSIELSSVFHRYFEKSMSAWQGKDSTVLNYDNQGNVIDEIHYEGDDSLVLSYRKTFMYSNKLLQKAFSYFWNTSNSSWDTISKTDFTYTNKDSIQTIVSYSLNNAVWVSSAKEQFQYDSKENLIHHDLLNWDATNNSWIPDNTNSWDYTYDLQNRRTTKITNVWNQQQKQLIQNQKELYTYNSNGELELMMRQIWDNQGNWHNSGKDSMIYQNGLQTENYTFYFDELKGSVWLKTVKESTTYNQNNDHYQTLVQYWSPTNSNYITDENARLVTSHYDNNNRIEFREDQMYDTVSKTFTDYDQTFFYYNNFQMAGIKSLNSNDEVQIQPNPACDVFKIISNAEVTSVFITDATGKMVKEFKNSNAFGLNHTFDITDLSEEIYFTTITTIDGTSIHKLLVKR
jgi:hypothetical protein